MDEIALLKWRLYCQLLAQPGLRTPADVVRYFGAIQAQELPGALYAVGLRARAATAASVEQAIGERQIVRTWPMRGTIHLVPAEDAAWMTSLLGPRTNRQAASLYRRVGLDADDFTRAGEILTGALRGGAILERRQLYTHLDAAGIATIAANGEQRGLHILGYWAREGLLCLGPHNGKQATYTLLAEWVPSARELSGDEALATLAERYFTSHGPATVQDFAWWTGLTLTEARRALSLVANRLQSVSDADSQYWFSAETPSDPPTTPSVVLLPQYDEYTVAYKQRALMRAPAFPDDPFLMLGPVVVVDGLVMGSWKRTLAKGSVNLAITLYRSLDEAQSAALEQAIAGYGRFQGMKVSSRIDCVG